MTVNIRVKVYFSVPYSSGHITAVKYDIHVRQAANSKKTSLLTSQSVTYMPKI